MVFRTRTQTPPAPTRLRPRQSEPSEERSISSYPQALSAWPAVSHPRLNAYRHAKASRLAEAASRANGRQMGGLQAPGSEGAGERAPTGEDGARAAGPQSLRSHQFQDALQKARARPRLLPTSARAMCVGPASGSARTLAASPAVAEKEGAAASDFRADGALKVVVAGARGLRKAGWLPGTSSDPYCVCRVAGKKSPDSCFRTGVIKAPRVSLAGHASRDAEKNSHRIAHR